MDIRTIAWIVFTATVYGIIVFLTVDKAVNRTNPMRLPGEESQIVQAFNEARTNVLVYYHGDDARSITIECTAGNYVLSRAEGRRFWILDLPLAWNACEVSHDIYTWPTFTFNPALGHYDSADNHE